MYEGLIQKEVFIACLQESNQTCLVPVPLYKSKLKKRGYNQAQLLTQGLSKKLNIPTTDLLIRVKNTPSQVGLERKKRVENIFGAFSVNFNIPAFAKAASFAEVATKAESAGEANIFLVDDVLTTGSTLLEAANILKRNGVKKVWGIALARD